MDKVQRNIIIGCILCSLIILTGVVLSLLPSILKLQYKQEFNTPVRVKTTPSTFDFRLAPPSQSHEIDFFVIHIDDDTWIPLYTKEYRDKKKQEMLEKKNGDAGK